jgi:oligogalacturonide lyase
MQAPVEVKGAVFPSDWRSYADASTELEVYRLTDPAYSSALPAYYNRAVARNRRFLLYSCDRTGSPQAFHMDLNSGQTRQLTQSPDLDGASLALLPNNLSFCYFAGRRLCLSNLAALTERAAYAVPDQSERGAGLSLTPDGTSALFIERQGDLRRVRIAPLGRGEARTVAEASFEISDPLMRPRRRQVLFHQGDAALWLADSSGQPNRRLKLAPGRVGPANWAPDGNTVLYLNFPADRAQLNTVREYAPDTDTDKLVAATSQYVHFGFNRDTSVFVGASRNAASPAVLIMLRINGRELTICEHRASHPESVAPIFSPDAQRLFFQSDRDGKPSIYCVHMERLVERIEEPGP